MMFGSNDKSTSIIVKLNRLTSSGQIKWRFEEPPRQIFRGTDSFIPIFMTAVYKHQKFALYQNRFQSYDADRDRMYWTENIILAIIDDEDRVIWETNEYYSALLDLFETARRKTANVDGIFDDILSDDEE